VGPVAGGGWLDYGGSTVRGVVRLLVLLALVLSGAVVTPLALASPSTSPAAGAAKGATARPAQRGQDDSLVTTIYAHPLSPSTSGKATFSYSANLPHQPDAPRVQFHCTLSGPGLPAVTSTCPVDQRTGDTTTGRVTYSKLTGSRRVYKFTVRAFIVTDPQDPSQDVNGVRDSYRWRIFNAWSPDHFLPDNGATFNRPLTRSRQRTNLTRVIRTINSMPGYKQAYPGLCPADPKLSPGIIHVSLYSMTDESFAHAMMAASRRCLSVQILMNNHLSRSTDPAWRHLEDAFGTRVRSKRGPRRSFAHRCHSGCRGGGVLHTKMYLFDSTIPNSKRNKIHNTVMFGSSNMTSNAAKIQYNDIFAQRDNPDLFHTFSRMFDLMKRDDGYHRNPGTYRNGVFQTTFWPQAHGAKDPYMKALDTISCSGATRGTGIGGHTVVYINMHAWFGTRGRSLAGKVRSLYNHGCYVRVLYSFMSYAVYKKLHRGTGSRMSVRRTIFSHNGEFAYVYSHLKNIAVSGHVGGSRYARVTWTGSNNFSNEGLNFDEVTVRIASSSAYRSYVRQFVYMRNRLSSAVYANFSEPSGGGRVPRTGGGLPHTPMDAESEQAPPGTPTILSPAVTVDADGQPHALD
jgi:hypothetical protein